MYLTIVHDTLSLCLFVCADSSKPLEESSQNFQVLTKVAFRWGDHGCGLGQWVWFGDMEDELSEIWHV